MAIHYFMPMAGDGTRFQNYSRPIFKPFFDIGSLSLFQYGLKIFNNLENSNCLHFIVKERDNVKFNAKEKILSLYPLANVHIINRSTRGALETLYLGVEMSNIQANDSIVSIDSDIFFVGEKFEKEMEKMFKKERNIIPFFHAKSSEHSFITIAENKVKQIQEKKQISDNAVVGCYGFYNKNDFFKYASTVLQDKRNMELGEFYISTLIKHMLDENSYFHPFLIEEFYNLGTPENIEKVVSRDSWSKLSFL